MPSRVQRFCSVPNFTQPAYRYGIALSCIGVLLNCLGVAQSFIEPIRYIGGGLVVVGSFLIISAMCRWMFLSPHHSTHSEVNSEDGGRGGDVGGDLHVITVPMGRSQQQQQQYTNSTLTTGITKPPDYFLVTEKPPSYEEAISMLPPYPASLQAHEGGLGSQEYLAQRYLAPHQVPEAEGATSIVWQDRGGYREATEPGVSLASSPPAYSSQSSLGPSILSVPNTPLVQSSHANPNRNSNSNSNSIHNVTNLNSPGNFGNSNSIQNLHNVANSPGNFRNSNSNSVQNLCFVSPANSNENGNDVQNVNNVCDNDGFKRAPSIDRLSKTSQVSKDKESECSELTISLPDGDLNNK